MVEAYDLANLSKNVGSKVWKGNVMPLLKLHLYELRIAKVLLNLKYSHIIFV
jgi:hypothetical protein